MVGLGTDVAGGYSLDIMDAMRQAITTSRMREGAKMIARAEGGLQEANSGESLSVDWREALYLATRGGALALGLPRGCGLFEVGAPFDVQCIRVFDPETNLGVGSLDFFDSVPVTNSARLSLELVEKWWSLGNSQNRVGMWVQGIKLTGE